MNAHVMGEIVTSLRWVNFPNNVKDMLGKIEHFYISCKANGMIWKPEVFVELINQFVYNVVDSRDIKRTRLTAVQQLQLADIILNYLSFSGNEVDREALFNTIFYSVNFQKTDVPLRILGLVTSLAVAFRKYEMLQCIALWMSRAGVDNPAVMSIAIDLSRDFVTDEFPEKYNYLPQKAYLFTAIFLIAVGKAYKMTPPPQRLMKQVIVWIESSPRVCFIAPQSAVFELFRWCIHPSSSSDETQDQHKLQLALLSAIDREGKGAQLQVIPHIMTLIQELRVKREHAITSSNDGGGNGGVSNLGGHYSHEVERGVDQLFQLIQLLISAESLDRNEIHPIFEASEEALLPRTQLYEMMKGVYFR